MDLNEQNNEIRKKLLNLPKLKSSENFLNDLYYKINKIDVKEVEAFQQKEKKGFISWFLRNPLTGNKNPWLIPAIGFTIILFFVFSVVFILNTNKNPNKNVQVTQTMESPIPESESKSLGENYKKDEPKEKEITEGFKTLETSPNVSDERITDQGKFKENREESPSVKKNYDAVYYQDTINMDKSAIRGSRSTEQNIIIDSKNALDEKKAETIKKEDDSKSGRVSKDKKDVKTEKDKEKEAIDTKSAIQGANEIDKDALQIIKDKLEKELKK